MSRGFRLGRRGLLAAGVACGTAALLPVAATAAVEDGPHRAVRFLDLMMDRYRTGYGPCLLPSYTDQVGLYSTCFTYDAALTVLAYLADQRAGSAGRAAALGRALRWAQRHDPLSADGRLRQAYTAGPYVRGDEHQADGLVRADGTANIGGPFHFTGSYLGDLAWTGLAYCALARRTGAAAWTGAARSVATWVLNTCAADGPLGGYRAGLARDGVARLAFQSTAHNAALAGFLHQLAVLTGEARYDDAARSARQFVRAMWYEAAGYFRRGSGDGHTPITTDPDIDSQAQSYLALSDPSLARCLDWAADRLSTVDTPGQPNSALPAGYSVAGITVSTASLTADPDTPIEEGLPKPDPAAVWLEGCAQLAAARSASRAALLTTLAEVQVRLGAGQTAGGRALPDGVGIVAATSPVSVGFDASGYYPARHIGATAWYLLAAAGVNPLVVGPG